MSQKKPQTRYRVRDILKPPFELDLVWLVLPSALIFLYLGALPLRSWDYWWHISIGRLIDHYGSVPAANHFLYTMPADAPSFVQPWLSQWMLFRMHDVGGVALVLLARNLIITTIFAALCLEATRRSRSAMLGALITLGSFALAAGYLDARTNLFIWPVFCGLLWLAYRIRAGRLPRFLLCLFPALTALWANLHGSFLLPAAICMAFGAAALFDRFDTRDSRSTVRTESANTQTEKNPSGWRPLIAWVTTLLLTLLAPLLNPRGAEIFGYVRDLSSNEEIKTTVMEWWPTTLSHPPGVGLLFYAVLGASALLLWRARKTLDIVDVFLIAGFGLLAILATRGVMIFSLVLPWALSTYLGQFITARNARLTHNDNEATDNHDEADDKNTPSSARPPRKSTEQKTPAWQSALNLLLVLGLLSAGVILQPGLKTHQAIIADLDVMDARREAPMKALVDAETPVMAAAILSQYPGPLRIFHDEKYAGYLIYHLTKYQPEQIVFVDQRVELPSRDIWRLYHAAIETSAWPGIFQQFQIDAVLLNKSNQPKLITALKETPGWEQLFEDDYMTLMMRRR